MKNHILYTTLIVSLICSSAFAGRTWFYNEITDSQGMPINQFQGADTAIGMRSGNAWPVVAYSGIGPNSSGVAAMLPGAWAKGPVSFASPGSYLDGATASDGTVGFVSSNGQVVTLSKTGWSSSYCSGDISAPFKKKSIAFNNNSAPGVLYTSGLGNLTLAMKSGGAWYSSTVQGSLFPPVQTDAYALDFDSYNQANVAFNDNGYLRYATKGVLTGNQWVFNSSQNVPVIGNNPTQMDMALAADDTPYVFYNDDNYSSSLLRYAVYDRQSNLWTTNILDMLANGAEFLCYS
jgi:hypothetical protein